MPKVPRFSSFKPASEAASRIKRHNRSRDAKAELMLRRELWRLGLRYRLHAIDLPGKPDIVFRGARIVVFCDGDFWHGRRWEQRREKLARGINAEYWTAKIEANVTRDRRTTSALRRAGWTVLRIWETDIIRNVERAAERVQRALTSRNLAGQSQRIHRGTP
jgi:DNA mismatch endonuclease, patch repair protein